MFVLESVSSGGEGAAKACVWAWERSFTAFILVLITTVLINMYGAKGALRGLRRYGIIERQLENITGSPSASLLWGKSSYSRMSSPVRNLPVDQMYTLLIDDYALLLLSW